MRVLAREKDDILAKIFFNFKQELNARIYARALLLKD